MTVALGPASTPTFTLLTSAARRRRVTGWGRVRQRLPLRPYRPRYLMNLEWSAEIGSAFPVPGRWLDLEEDWQLDLRGPFGSPGTG